MAELIQFDTGVKTYDLNGKITVSFSPTDLAFIERVYTALERMDAAQEKYKAVADKENTKEVFHIARQMDEEARAEINGIFGLDVCSALFGSINIFAIADGFPIWANFLLAIVEQFEGAYNAEAKKKNPRLEKYIAKYRK